jgi:hypothetical protein
MSVLSAHISLDADGLTNVALRALGCFPDWRAELDLENVAQELKVDWLAYREFSSPPIDSSVSVVLVRNPFNFTNRYG